MAPAPLAYFGLQLPPPAAEREGEAYVELGRGAEAVDVKWRGKRAEGEEERGGLAREVKTIEAAQRELDGGGDPGGRESVRGGEILK